MIQSPGFSVAAAERQRLSDAIQDVRRTLTTVQADVTRARGAFANLGDLSSLADVRAAVKLAQAIADSGIEANVAATACAVSCEVLEALAAAGKEAT